MTSAGRIRTRSNARKIAYRVTKWGRQHRRSYPWRGGDNDWLALIAELLLQRTRASAVIPVWLEFANKYPTPKALVRAPESELAEVVAPLGLNWRVPLIAKLAETLANLGSVPGNQASLQQLPGVGEYAASAYLSLHLGVRSVIVDANIVRWICRLTEDPYDGETRRKNWIKELAEILTPATTYRDYNYAVLDLTMKVCRKKPSCEDCPVRVYCALGNRRHQLSGRIS